LEEEFIKTYDKLSDAIFRHCYFRISDKEKAMDLVQDAFTKSWEHILKGGEIKNFKSFIYRVAHNLIVDYYRKNKEYSLDDLTEKGMILESKDHEKIVSLVEAKESLKFVSQLEEKYRTAIIMRFINDLSVKEISEILEESENNISVRIYRGLEKLRELIK
jgi:RNA polymerase sigma-70 factor, ECF subfamily